MGFCNMLVQFTGCPFLPSSYEVVKGAIKDPFKIQKFKFSKTLNFHLSIILAQEKENQALNPFRKIVTV